MKNTAIIDRKCKEITLEYSAASMEGKLITDHIDKIVKIALNIINVEKITANYLFLDVGYPAKKPKREIN